MKTVKDYSTLIILLSSIGLSYLIKIEKIVTLMSILIILLFIIFFKELTKKVNIRFTFFNELNIGWYALVIFIFTFITQNVYLNFETITWDTASYLVASAEVRGGNIPMETQWESKGPLLFYIYSFLSNISDGSFIKFRLISDLVLFLVAMNIFVNISILSKGDKTKSFIASLLFILLTSKVWYVSEFSELYCLLFLSSAYLITSYFNKQEKTLIIVGLLISFSTLINQGSIIFFIPFLIDILTNYQKNKRVKNILFYLIGFLAPHVLFVYAYYSKNLLDVYFASYITIPLGYTEQSLSSLYELRVWIREFYRYDRFLYFGFFSLNFSFFLLNYKKIKIYFKEIYVWGVLLAVVIYFIGSHNYYHHLFYLLFFIPFLLLGIRDNKFQIIIYTFILISGVSIFLSSYQNSYKNLRSIETTENNYPLYQLSEEIDSNFDTDFDILALDYVLILFYLEKPNYSYIVHPMNHFEEFITSVLIDLNKIPEKNVKKLIKEEPDVIICNTTMIINGVETRIDKEYNCEINEYKNNYKKLDTTEYRENPNLFYYKDSTRKINVFIKNK